jgi:hypothetical protein
MFAVKELFSYVYNLRIFPSFISLFDVYFIDKSGLILWCFVIFFL